MLVGAFLAVIVLLFAGYVGLQLVRFSQVPPLTLDGQLVRTVAADQTSVSVTGTAARWRDHRRVRRRRSSRPAPPWPTAQGRWTLDLPVQKGQNDFTISTRDPETGRDADPLPVIVNVPVLRDAIGRADARTDGRSRASSRARPTRPSRRSRRTWLRHRHPRWVRPRSRSRRRAPGSGAAMPR